MQQLVTKPLDRPASVSVLRGIVRFTLRRAIGVPLLMLVVAGATAISAPLISPYGHQQADVLHRLEPPSSNHYFGTDNIGRDLFSRTVYGGRVSLLIGTVVMIGVMIGATLIGVISGYLGGAVDLIFQRIIDSAQALPTLLALLVVIALIGQGVWNVAIALILLTSISQSRILRGSVISVRDATFVEAARVVGASPLRIVWAHIIPNIMPLVIVVGTLSFGAAVLAEASLSFLGHGVPASQPSWGVMLREGRLVMTRSPWVVLWPGLFLAITVFAINLLGDALRDRLDPRLRGAR